MSFGLGCLAEREKRRERMNEKWKMKVKIYQSDKQARLVVGDFGVRHMWDEISHKIFKKSSDASVVWHAGR